MKRESMELIPIYLWVSIWDVKIVYTVINIFSHNLGTITYKKTSSDLLDVSNLIA